MFHFNSLMAHFDNPDKDVMITNDRVGDDQKFTGTPKHLPQFDDFSFNVEVEKYSQEDIQNLDKTSKHFRQKCLDELYNIR